MGGAEEVQVDQLLEGLCGRDEWRKSAAGGDACACEQRAVGGRTPHARHSPRHSRPPCCAPVFAFQDPWCEKAPTKRCLVGTLSIRRNDPYMEAIADPQMKGNEPIPGHGRPGWSSGTPKAAIHSPGYFGGGRSGCHGASDRYLLIWGYMLSSRRAARPRARTRAIPHGYLS